MTTTTTRRAMLAGAAALPVLALATTAAVVAPSVAPAQVLNQSADVELLRLIDQYVEAHQEWDRASLASDRLEGMIGRPVVPRPKALRVRKSDRGLGLPKNIYGPRTGYYDTPNYVSYLRKERWWSGKRESIRTDEMWGSVERSYVPSAAARARADEIIAAFEAWEAKGKLPPPEGLDEAKQREEIANDRQHDLLTQIEVTPAHTLAGVVAKARAMKATFGSEEINATSGFLECDLAVSIFEDLLRFGSAVQIGGLT